MTNPQAIQISALFVAAVVAFSWWRYRAARDIALDYLARNRYRVRKFGMGFHILPKFAGTFGRNYQHSHEFRAEVDDLRLGGTGVVWLRVYTDWLGSLQQEPEVSWERMPRENDETSRTAEDKWWDAQLSLLARVAAGESSFRSRARSGDEREEFDEVVEHVMALERRGLVKASAPVLNGMGAAQYDSVSNVSITPKGQQLLDEQERGKNERDAAARRARRSSL